MAKALKKGILCKLNLHRYHYVRTMEVPCEGYYKVFKLYRCKKCGKIHSVFSDVRISNIMTDVQDGPKGYGSVYHLTYW